MPLTTPARSCPRPFALLSAVLCLLGTSHYVSDAAAQTPAYTVTDLGRYLNGYSSANGISNTGLITGYAYFSTTNNFHASLFYDKTSPPTHLDLGTLGGNSSYAYSINDAGWMAGASTLSMAGQHATLYTFSHKAPALLDLGTLGGNRSAAYGINNAGLMAGFGSLTNDNIIHAALFQVDGNTVTRTDLGTLGGTSSSAQNLNDLGQVVGSSQLTGNKETHATLFSVNDGTVTRTDLGTLGSGLSSTAYAINNTGLIVGSSYIDSDYDHQHAALFQVVNGAVVRTDLETQADAYSAAYAVNSAGQVVGNTTAGTPGYQHAFLYSAATGMQDLATLVGPNSPVARIYVDFYSTGSNAINDWGQIVGYGITTDGLYHAVLLNPTAPTITTSGAAQDARIIAGANYQSIPAFRNPAPKGNQTVLSLLDGTVGGTGAGAYGLNRDLYAKFTVNPASTPLASDAVDLEGSGSDPFVVQLSYDSGLASLLFNTPNNARLGWFDGKHWVLAAAGNTGGAVRYVGNRPYAAATDFHVGTCGIDTQAMVVWAVVNHDGLFGVTLDPEALRKVTSFSRMGTSTFLTTDAYQGHSYQLQRATQPDNNAFVDVGPPQTATNSGTMYFKYTDDPAVTRAFFRIKLDP